MQTLTMNVYKDTLYTLGIRTAIKRIQKRKEIVYTSIESGKPLYRIGTLGATLLNASDINLVYTLEKLQRTQRTELKKLNTTYQLVNFFL